MFENREVSLSPSKRDRLAREVTFEEEEEEEEYFI